MQVCALSYGCVVGMLHGAAHILSNDSEHMKVLVFSVQRLEKRNHSLQETNMQEATTMGVPDCGIIATHEKHIKILI